MFLYWPSSLLTHTRHPSVKLRLFENECRRFLSSILVVVSNFFSFFHSHSVFLTMMKILLQAKWCELTSVQLLISFWFKSIISFYKKRPTIARQELCLHNNWKWTDNIYWVWDLDFSSLYSSKISTTDFLLYMIWHDEMIAVESCFLLFIEVERKSMLTGDQKLSVYFHWIYNWIAHLGEIG